MKILDDLNLTTTEIINKNGDLVVGYKLMMVSVIAVLWISRLNGYIIFRT